MGNDMKKMVDDLKSKVLEVSKGNIIKKIYLSELFLQTAILNNNGREISHLINVSGMKILGHDTQIDKRAKRWFYNRGLI